MKRIYLYLLMLLSLLGACSTLSHAPAQKLALDAKWALLPMSNYTETPQAGARMTEISAALLQEAGISQLLRYVPATVEDPLIGGDSTAEYQKAIEWAKAQGAKYGVTGAVEEWRYKTGVEGEPAVGVTLQIIDLESQTTVWSGAGAKSGWARDSVSAVAQKLIGELIGKAGIGA
ncbi:MAG: penicillin-binding protein activator LpoB [Gammaproteobacteria bacterium]